MWLYKEEQATPQPFEHTYLFLNTYTFASVFCVTALIAVHSNGPADFFFHVVKASFYKSL